MAEVGVDISGYRSKLLDEVKEIKFDWVITVCDNANESCPVFPGTVNRFHVNFDDPPVLAHHAKTEEEILIATGRFGIRFGCLLLACRKICPRDSRAKILDDGFFHYAVIQNHQKPPGNKRFLDFLD